MKQYRGMDKREKIIEGIDEEFQDLADGLSDMDFSKESNKNFVLETTMKNIYEKECDEVSKIKKTGVIAASLLIASTLVAQTSFAQEAVNNIIKKISLGHFTAIQTDNVIENNTTYIKEDNYDKTLSDNLKGKLFDKNGNIIERLTKDIVRDGIYTKNGEKVSEVHNDGSIITEKQIDEEFEKDFIVVTDKSKINDYTCFEVKLPRYLPDGYTFEKAVFDKNEEKNIKGGKTASLHFINQTTGNKIGIMEWLACEETKSTLISPNKIENFKINDADAVIVGKDSTWNIHWEADGAIYYLGGKNIGKDEVIKVAESIK